MEKNKGKEDIVVYCSGGKNMEHPGVYIKLRWEGESYFARCKYCNKKFFYGSMHST